MKDEIEDLKSRVEELESALGVSSWPIEELESIQIEPMGFVSGSISAHSSGNHRKWRETRDLRGAIKYSNWSVNVVIKDQSSAPLKCEYIKVSDCNFSIKQAGTVVETSSISFTTHDKKGWNDIAFKLTVRYQGSIYTWERITLG